MNDRSIFWFGRRAWLVLAASGLGAASCDAASVPTPSADSSAGAEAGTDPGGGAEAVGSDATTDASPPADGALAETAPGETAPGGPDIPSLDTPPPDAYLPPDPPALNPEDANGLCNDFCQQIAAGCPGLGELGGSPEACATACAARLADSTWWLIAYACTATSCDHAACFGDGEGPPEPVWQCAEACDDLVACKTFASIGLEKGSTVGVGECNISCSGQALAHGLEAMACVTSALGADCDNQAVYDQCFEAFGCDMLCGLLHESKDQPAPVPDGGGGGGGGGQQGGGAGACGEGTPFFAAWPEKQQCRVACEGLPLAERAIFVGCQKASGCADPAECLGADLSSDAGCTGLCEALWDKCAPIPDFLPTAQICAGVCSGMLSGEPSKPGAADCGTTIECPPENPVGDDRNFLAEFSACFLPPSEACSAVCAMFVKCAPPKVLEETPFQGEEQCGSLCTLEFQYEPGFDALTACFAAAEGDCDKAPPCLDLIGSDKTGGGIGPEQLCGPACDHLAQLGCGLDGCEGQCQYEFGVDYLKAAADWTCRITTKDCPAATACEAGLSQGVLPECAAACDGAEVCPSDKGSLCGPMCSGALAGFGMSGAGLAQCVVGKLGQGCELQGLYECLGP
jgi:hypothetical protein